MTGRSGWEVGFGLAALVAGVALGIVALLAGLGEEEPRHSLPAGLTASASLSPVVVRFADPASARVDVIVDRKRVDVDSVRLRARFAPLGARQGAVERRDTGDLTTLSYLFTLRCAAVRCLPPRYAVKRELELAPARVTYRTRLQASDQSRQVPWPLLAIVSRVSGRELARSQRANPLRIDDLSTSGLTLGHIAGSWKESSDTLPEPSYRISATVLTAGLFGLSGLVALAACGLVATQVRPETTGRRAVAAAGSPLTQALGTLDVALMNGHVADRRRALELVARVLHDHGEDALAERARRLAWAEATSKDDARSLAAEVRGLEGAGDGDAA